MTKRGITYDTLGKFIAREFGNLPTDKRPKQTPVRKGEVSGGEIVLASYPNLKKTKLNFNNIKDNQFISIFQGVGFTIGISGNISKRPLNQNSKYSK